MAVSKLSSTNVLGKMDAKMLAALLQKMGRGNDTVLAHITPREARKLKREGGRGSINPDTGLLEFDDDFGASFPLTYDTSSYDVPTYGPDFSEGFDAGGQAYSDPNAGYFADGSSFAPEAVTAYQPQADFFGGGGTGGFVSGQQQMFTPDVATPANVPTPFSRAEVFDQGAEYPVSEEAATADAEYKGDTGLFGKITASDLLKGALAGGTGLMGYLNQQRAMDQAKRAAGQFTGAQTQAAEQIKSLASPYLQIGGTQLAQALQGQLDPARLRQLEITRAKLAQSAARTGGVGAIQAATAMERARQDALTAQQEAAFKLLGPGNDLAYKALMAQLQGTTGGLNLQLALTQQAQSAASNLYSQIGRYVAEV